MDLRNDLGGVTVQPRKNEVGMTNMVMWIF